MKNINDRRNHSQGRIVRRDASFQATRLVLVLTLCIVALGCVAPKRATFTVPRRCVKVEAQSFTRPCQQRPDGKLLCDGVVVTAQCLEVPR
jgi:hypothetical protein